MMFPSPIGVLYISMIETLYAQLITDPFPSPIGVLYISMGKSNYEKYAETSFRPLLGFFIFQ